MNRSILLVVVLAFTPSITGCQKLPEEKWAALKELRTELRREESNRYTGQGFQAFEERFARIRLSFRRAAAQAPFLRKSRDLDSELTRHLASGKALLAETKSSKDALSREQARELTVITRTLDSLIPTLHPDLRGQLASLRLMLAQATEFWRKGDYLRVAPLLEQARAAAESLTKDFSQLLGRLEDPGWVAQWNKLGQETIRWSRVNGKPALLIDKFGRQAFVYQDGRLKRQIPVELGWNGLADKIRAGDGATPEGKYRVLEKRGPDRTRYFRALLLDYPNDADWVRFRNARRAGEIEKGAGIGGLIEVHGDGGRGTDWTQGCVALENSAMKELFELAYEGMPVTIVGRFEP